MQDFLDLTPEDREAFGDMIDPETGNLIQRLDWQGTEPAEQKSKGPVSGATGVRRELAADSR